MIKPKYGVKCLHLGFDRYKRKMSESERFVQMWGKKCRFGQKGW